MHQLKPVPRLLLNRLILAVTFLFTMKAAAESAAVGYDFKVEKQITKSVIQLSYQTSQLKTDSEQLSSSGLLFGYDYDFTKEISIQSQYLLSMQQSGTSTMTGFGIFGVYNFFRSSNEKSVIVKIDNKQLISLENHFGHYLELGAGAQQFYFNGSRGVYSVSGPAVRLAYNFGLFGLNTSVGYQSASVKLSEKATQLTSILFGLTFPL